jgi:HemY protein
LHPHPDLARLYLDIRPESDPIARAAALQRLAVKNPDAPETHLAQAEAALTAQLWGEARHHLDAVAAPMSDAGSEPAERSALSRRLCLLMARLEEGEGRDLAAARGWLDRAIKAPPDPAYVCRNCGGGSLDWQPPCPQCGGFDTLAWGVPSGAGRTLPAPGSTDIASLVLPPASGLPDPAAEAAPAGPMAHPGSSGLAKTAQ